MKKIIRRMSRNFGAIQKTQYETTDGKRSEGYQKQAEEAQSLLLAEQKRVGRKYKVKLEIRTFGNLRVPFFVYDLRTPSALAERISRTLKRVERNTQSRKKRQPILEDEGV